MKLSNLVKITTAAILLAATVNPVYAAKGGNTDNNGNGKGGSGNGGGGGGSGFDTPVEYHLAIGFRDADGDGVQSDGGIYYDGDLGLEGEDPLLNAHFDASAGSNYGNLYLRTTDTNARSVYLDITDCQANCDNPPFAADEFHDLGLTVAATHALGGGFCGMAIDQTITAPMEITYRMPGIDFPGFVLYEPGYKGGKSLCKGSNGSAEVTVVRESGDAWTVSGTLACVTAPYDEWGGLVNMPFEFYVTNLTDPNCQ